MNAVHLVLMHQGAAIIDAEYFKEAAVLWIAQIPAIFISLFHQLGGTGGDSGDSPQGSLTAAVRALRRDRGSLVFLGLEF